MLKMEFTFKGDKKKQQIDTFEKWELLIFGLFVKKKVNKLYSLLMHLLKSAYYFLN